MRSGQNLQAELEGMPKILVFGGNGYVGTKVCEEALKTGLQVVSINRSGKPRGTDAWINEVDWVQASYGLGPVSTGSCTI